VTLWKNWRFFQAAGSCVVKTQRTGSRGDDGRGDAGTNDRLISEGGPGESRGKGGREKKNQDRPEKKKASGDHVTQRL